MFQLLRLGRLLRISDQLKSSAAEGDGRVMSLVARKALESRDFDAAAELCFRLIEASYAHAWVECKMLAEEEDFRDLRSKYAHL